MPTIVVQHRASAGQADDVERLIGAMFEELERRRPEGLRHTCLRLDDDVFVHVIDVAGGSHHDGLTMETIDRITATLGAGRCAVPHRHARTIGDFDGLTHRPVLRRGLGQVEELCRLQLAARDLGCRILVHDADASLLALITLAGLGETLLGRDASMCPPNAVR